MALPITMLVGSSSSSSVSKKNYHNYIFYCEPSYVKVKSKIFIVWTRRNYCAIRLAEKEDYCASV